MNAWRGMTMGLVVAGLMVSLPAVVLADPALHTAREAAFVKLLRDSAGALQASHSDLAVGLTQLADEEAKELPAGKTGMEHKPEVAEKVEAAMQARHEAHAKLLRDSAAALQASRPELSAELIKAADRNAKRMAAEYKEEAKEIREKK